MLRDLESRFVGDRADQLFQIIPLEDGRLAALLKQKTPDEAVAEELFLATLARKPSADEWKAVREALANGESKEEVFRDLFWVLLNSPEFLDVFLTLEPDELKQVVGTLERIRRLDWSTLYRHHGLKWEAIDHLPTPNGAKAHSLRLSQKIRAIAYRDGPFLRFVSLHPDHDSAYRR